MVQYFSLRIFLKLFNFNPLIRPPAERISHDEDETFGPRQVERTASQLPHLKLAPLVHPKSNVQNCGF